MKAEEICRQRQLQLIPVVPVVSDFPNFQMTCDEGKHEDIWWL
jgi:hypothetical protein